MMKQPITRQVAGPSKGEKGQVSAYQPADGTLMGMNYCGLILTSGVCVCVGGGVGNDVFQCW